MRENNPTLDKTTTWCYDVSGNVCSRTEYAYTTGTVGTPVATFNYAYGNGWKDQLTAYNGQSITYDQAGNPTSYKGATLGWTRGRLLASYNSVSMQYDANGIRTRKVVPTTNGTETTEYIYSGSNLLHEKVTSTGNQAETSRKYFLYNSQGVVGFVLNGTTYMFRKNFFGDVTAIYRGATKVAEYAYDAWGNCTIVSDTNGIGTANPFRYRSYYWDNDLQLYYLMSRYYDPQTGRFLNADGLEYLDPETLGGLNLYAYCGNNPVMGIDPSGNFILSTAVIVAALIAGAIAGAFYGGITAHENGQNVLAGILVGAVSGALMSLGAAFAGAFIAPVLAGTVTGLTAIGSIAIGTTIAFGSGSLVGASAEATLQAINNNGKVVDVGAVLWSGLEWGILNVQNAFTSSTAGELLGFVNNFAIGLANNFLTGAIGLLIDLLRNPKFRGEYNYKKVVKGAAV